MGGRALKTFTRRYNRKEFEKIKNEISSLLEQSEYKEYFIPTAFSSKKDFGDLDCIIKNPTHLSFDKIKYFIKENFGDVEIFKNDHTYSFPYKDFQIDFILCLADQYLPHVQFYRNGELANLLGRIFRCLNLKFSSRGLVWKIKLDFDQVVDEVIITPDLSEAVEWIGLSGEKFNQGFESELEQWLWLEKSPFWSTAIFRLEWLTNENRSRNKRRPSYIKFLEWLETRQEVQLDYPSREYVLNWIEDRWPNAKCREKEEKALKEARIRLINHDKFNGNLVMEWTGLSGEMLGRVIGSYKSRNKKFQEFLTSKTSEEVRQDFKYWYNIEGQFIAYPTLSLYLS